MDRLLIPLPLKTRIPFGGENYLNYPISRDMIFLKSLYRYDGVCRYLGVSQGMRFHD